jgi:hypothetical protein
MDTPPTNDERIEIAMGTADGGYPNPYSLDWAHCPHCGHDQLDGDNLYVEGTYAAQAITCAGCGNTWTERYVRYARVI